jgi:hypothetical protein
VWEDNIKVGLKEIGYEDVDCILLAEDKNQWRTVVNADLRKSVGIS